MKPVFLLSAMTLLLLGSGAASQNPRIPRILRLKLAKGRKSLQLPDAQRATTPMAARNWLTAQLSSDASQRPKILKPAWAHA